MQHPTGLLAVLLVVLALIFKASEHPVLGRVFKIVPPLVFCYFVPATLTALRVIPAASDLYDWVKTFVLPASLLLLTISLDIHEIIRLGPKAVIMMLVGTASIVVGGPIALLLTRHWLPPDAWQGMAALSGSWIGGAANMIAIQKSVGASDDLIGLIVVVDTGVAGVWMGLLIYLAGRHESIDARTRADASAIRHLEQKMAEFQASVRRIPTLTDLMVLLALGFGTCWACYVAGKEIDGRFTPMLPEGAQEIISATTWTIILVTTTGLVLSLTPARRLEGAGASQVGSVMLYLLVACIGAHADLREIVKAPAFLLMGVVWMAVHGVVMFSVARLIRAPVFFMAVGSQANVGGAASAPVVASAFNPVLAPVGVLLGVAGYVLGTYAGLICATLLRWVA
ncbi:MAG: DUF819 family protein [Phycisphaerales bacterium]|nr:MAG: DUF819 family protein [Phycisphaerales bacterium]